MSLNANTVATTLFNFSVPKTGTPKGWVPPQPKPKVVDDGFQIVKNGWKMRTYKSPAVVVATTTIDLPDDKPAEAIGSGKSHSKNMKRKAKRLAAKTAKSCL